MSLILPSRTDTTTKRIYIPVSQIVEGDRVRAEYGNLNELADSIKEQGLIHPVVIDLNYRLVAGGRRFRAMRDVLKLTEVPITFIEVADEATLRRLEAEENVRRKDMTWQERIRSVETVHQHQVLKAALSSSTWTQTMTGQLLGSGYSQANVSYALIIGALLRRGDTEVAKCDTFSDAIRLVVQRKENELNAALAKSTIGSTPTGAKVVDILAADGADFFADPDRPAGPVVGLASRPDVELPSDVAPTSLVIPLSSMLFHADSLAWMASQPPASIDHIVTDPPYGIDTDMMERNQHGGMNDVASIRAEHDVAENEILHSKMFEHFYRLLKPDAFCILWADVMQWQAQYDHAIAAGFKVQRWPLIWHKTHQCMNQTAQYNFTKSYEIAMVCRKGNATLVTPQSSAIWQGTIGAEKEALGHPFTKPANLWKWLYSAIAIRGQRVLDPFAGSGSATLAAISVGLSPVGVECNEAHYNRLVVNVSNHYRTLNPNTSFT